MSDLLGFGPVFPCSPLVPPLGMGMFFVCCSTVEAHNLYLILQLRFVLGLRRAFGGVNSVGPVKIMKWTECSLRYYRHEPGGGRGRKDLVDTLWVSILGSQIAELFWEAVRHTGSNWTSQVTGRWLEGYHLSLSPSLLFLLPGLLCCSCCRDLHHDFLSVADRNKSFLP